jgi:hypothetical protein
LQMNGTPKVGVRAGEEEPWYTGYHIAWAVTALMGLGGVVCFLLADRVDILDTPILRMLVGSLIGWALTTAIALFRHSGDQYKTQSRRYIKGAYIFGWAIAPAVCIVVYLLMSPEQTLTFGGLEIDVRTDKGWTLLGVVVGFSWQHVLMTILPNRLAGRTG